MAVGVGSIGLLGRMMRSSDDDGLLGVLDCCCVE